MSNYKIIPTKDNEFVLVDTTRMAKYETSEYSLSITGVISQLDLSKNVLWKDGCYPIIAATRKIGNLPLISNSREEILELIEKAKVEKLSLEAVPTDILETSKGCFDDLNDAERYSWIRGYKSNPAKFTKEILVKAMGYAYACGKENMSREESTAYLKEYVDDLMTAPECFCEIRMEIMDEHKDKYGDLRMNKFQPKLNEEGKITITKILTL